MLLKSNYPNSPTMFLAEAELGDFPKELEGLDGFTSGFSRFYIARNPFNKDSIYFYVARVQRSSSRQEIVVWYSNKRLWHSYGTTFRGAIEGAQRDGWQYAR